MAAFPNVPGTQVIATGVSLLLASGATKVVALPFTSDGNKPARIRVALSAGAAYVKLGLTATSATALTTDTVITAYESIVLLTLGNTAIAGRTVTTGSTDGVLQVSPLEDGSLIPSNSSIG